MKNPFDKIKEPEKYEIFKSVIEAIDICIENNYPNLFDHDLEVKADKIINLQDEILKSFSNHRQAVLNERQDTVKIITDQINDFLKKEYPDLNKSLTLTTLELQKYSDKMKGDSQKLDKKLKELVYHNSVYEDVAKLRDEMKEIQKTVEGFTKKIQKAFG